MLKSSESIRQFLDRPRETDAICGRFNLRTNPHEFAEIFAIIRGISDEDLTPRYNVAPTQTIPIVRGVTGDREASVTVWGFNPPWTRAPLVNAKCETLTTLSTFKKAFRERRCLIPTIGFYEWEKQGKTKLPWNFTVKDSPLFAFAGLWTTDEDGLRSTILTTEANSLLARVHNRMPVILRPEDYDTWLADGELSEAEAARLFDPFPPDEMEEARANPAMNNVRFQGEESLIVPKNSE
jgi:putative SOS response-associated peptidase YedK